MPLSRRTLIGSSLAAATAVAVRPAQAAANVLRIGISTSLNTLDPMMVTTGDEYIYANLVFNGLARMREDLVVEPDLAESWSFSDDLKRWTFRLRRGVKFHDGQEMVADDVVASFRRLLDPAGTSPVRSQYDMVDSVSAPDAATVDGVELRIIPEMSVKIAALQAGDIDVLWDLPLEQVKPLAGRADIRIDS